ncbi:hemagglutinin repeat-containing protein [Cupriavidus nantongensis]|uniref:hemagglutinin repeat-containing protein n=1 Tax=Cupriavidus nantongensis TaxID=1796606 RepID=UPI00358F3FB8
MTQSDARSVVGASNGNVIISAGKDATIIGSDLIAGSRGNKEAASAGNIDILAQNVTIAEGVDRVYQDASQSNRSSGLSVALVGTPYDTVKNLQAVQKDPSTVSRVTGTVKELGASALTLPQVDVRIGNQKSNAQGTSVTTTSSGSSVNGAGNVRVRATGNGETDANGKALDGNILVSGSTISAGDAAILDAARDVTVRASTDTYQAANSASSSGWTVSSALPSPGDMARHLGGGPNNSGVGMVPFGTQASQATGATASSKQNASLITGNTVGVKARTGDITIAGSGIAADGDVALSAAKGKIDILSGQDTLSQRSDSTSRQIGDLGGTGYSGTVGVRSESHHADASQATQNTIRSQVVSKSGNVTMAAGETITARGADIEAGNDVTMIGKNVILDPGTDSASQNERHRTSQYGTTLALSGYTVTAAQAVENAARAVEDKKDGRVATLYGVQAGLAIANGIQGIQTVTSGGVSQTAAIKVTASIGGGSQSSEAHSTSSTNQGTTVKAGNAVTIVATGSGQQDAEGFATDGDISGRGAQIEGKTVTLSAARDVNLESAQDRSTLDNRSSGSNASVGVGFGLGGDQNGFTLELAASQNKAKANGEAVTNHNSHVVATDKVTVVSGRDTNLKGAQLIGDTVAGTVGRDLNIESRPDTETYHSKESSSGMQASICVPPFCYGTTVHANASLTQGNTDSTYSSVQEQSGIYAGQGGFNVDVKGHTDLKGGILASTADANKNSLTTGTLTTSDIENKAEYSSDSTTIVASYSGGKSVPASNPNLGPVQPAHVDWAGNTNLLQSGASSLAATAAGNAQKSIDGSAAGITKSAIAPGTVIITDEAGQRAKAGQSADETIAGLNRDTANANQSIDKIFDAQKVKDQRELNQLRSQVAQQLAPMIYDQVGTLTRDRSPEVKVAVHAVIGGLMAQAMGGSFAAGAAGDAAATLAAELVGQQILNNPDLQKLSEQDRKALVQIAGTIVAAGAGAAGGSTQDAAAAGAAGGLGTQYNYLKHTTDPKASQLEEFKRDLMICKADSGCNTDDIYAKWSTESRRNQFEAMSSDRDAGAAEWGKQIGWAAAAMSANPADYCPPGDGRCYSFIQQQSKEAAVVMRNATALAASLDYAEGGMGRYGRQTSLSGGGASEKTPGGAGAPDDSTFFLGEKQLSKAPGSLIGPPEAPPRNASAEQVRSIARQNEAAATLADHGLNVENLPNTGKRGPNPDIRINGEIADIYSPRTGNLWSIRDTVVGKVDKQATNVVVNLADSSLTPTEVAQHFQKNPIPGMNSLFIIKNGSVTILGK